eukprot:jgi/Psemu1/67851/estExt_Genemark1.C_3800029
MPTSNDRESPLSPATKAGTNGVVPRVKIAVNFPTANVGAAAVAPLPATSSLSVLPARSTRPFRSIVDNGTKWVTREIAALEFLQTGIPMAKEGSIVHEGWMRQHNHNRSQQITHQQQSNFTEYSSDTNFDGISDPKNSYQGQTRSKAAGEGVEEEKNPHIAPSLMPLGRIQSNSTTPDLVRQGRWWEKWIVGQNLKDNQQQQKDVDVIEDLEEPDLEGDDAVKVQIPLANALNNKESGGGVVGGGGFVPEHQLKRQNSDFAPLQSTSHQSIARMAILREWELKVAHGLEERNLHGQNNSHQHQHQQRHNNPAMLDGRMYMSAKESYPMMVFSLLRYEPKKEEAVRRRQKLEERGGGGTQFFIMPSRDWRGISYRALLQPVPTHKDESLPPDESEQAEAITSTATTPIRRNKNNQRLLFDRFAPKRSGLKDFDGSDPIADSEKKNDERNPQESINENDDLDADSDEEDEKPSDDTYVAGLLDDPEMVQGRHRNVMIGDRGTGPIVSSTIQFVKPKLLKADLNKQFRERFDGYEPPESQRKFIKAKVVDGMYTLMDPTQELGGEDDDGSSMKEDDNDTTGANTTATSGTPTTGANSTSTQTKSTNTRFHRRRLGSTSSVSLSTGGASSIDEGGSEGGRETIRMPPSLTLSKIRSLKQQALAAAVRAKLEISTVALAIIYFERLCLDCRVDKSNRRLSFAACLLLAIKINEAHVGIIITKAVEETNKKSKTSQRIQSLIRPTKKSSNMFASLLVFFTEDWNISLKHLFAAEWGVFAALQFRLTAKPSDVAFHFKRLMKTLGSNPRRYLGSQVYGSWQQTLAEEEFRRQEWEVRAEARRQRKEKKKLEQLQREIEAADRRGSTSSHEGSVGEKYNEKNGEDALDESGKSFDEQKVLPPQSTSNATRRRRYFGDILKTRLSSASIAGQPKRSVSTERTSIKRQGNAEIIAATASVKFNPTSAITGGSGKQRPRPPLLRPLSQSKSMLSLTSKGRELMGKNLPLDDTSKSSTALRIMKEENYDSKGRQCASDDTRSIDEEGGIVI